MTTGDFHNTVSPGENDNTGCLTFLVAIFSAILFFISLAVTVIGLAVGSMAKSPTFASFVVAATFCGYFGLIFLSCFSFARGKLLVTFGVIITILDLVWSGTMIFLFIQRMPDNPEIALLLLVSFPLMNVLWYKAVRGKLRSNR